MVRDVQLHSISCTQFNTKMFHKAHFNSPVSQRYLATTYPDSHRQKPRRHYGLGPITLEVFYLHSVNTTIQLKF